MDVWQREEGALENMTRSPESRLTFSADDVGLALSITSDRGRLGKITGYNASTGRHVVANGDGDLRMYDLRQELFVVQSSMQARLLQSARLDEAELPVSPQAKAASSSASKITGLYRPDGSPSAR